jgi:hypothetical protein
VGLLIQGDLIPVTRALAYELPSDLLYKLERAGEISRQILDERIVEWAADGWTQSAIADELGCSQPAISKRMTRLGIEPAHPEQQRPRSHNQVMRALNGDGPLEDVEVFSADAEGVCPTCHGTGRVPIEQSEVIR